MLKLKQYFCKHDFELIARHKIVSENLYQCSKCNVYMLNHWGLGIFVKFKELVNADKWRFIDK